MKHLAYATAILLWTFVGCSSPSSPTATTDSNGFYSLPGLYASTVITASRTGYVTGTEQVMIVGDTRLDIELARLPSFTLSGVVFEETPTGRVPVDKVQMYCRRLVTVNGDTQFDIQVRRR